MNNKILKEKILMLLANQDDSAALESVYALLKSHFEKPKGNPRQLVLTNHQRSCIDRAVKAKNIERQPDGTLRWLHSSKVLLAYFCGRVFCGDDTKTDANGKACWKCGKGQFPSAALERLFHTTALKQLRQNRLRLSSPKDHELVDDFFDYRPI